MILLAGKDAICFDTHFAAENIGHVIKIKYVRPLYVCPYKTPKLERVITLHYENMPIQIYRKFHLQKLKKIRLKNSDILYISSQNIDCGYSLEPPRRGGSNEYHNLCF